MPSTQEFRPDWISAPGDTITDILRERDLSELEFAERLGQTTEEARDLLQGRATITIGIARQLEKALGASVEFWMSRDFQYRQDVDRLEAEREWLTELPVGDMIRFGWVSPVPHPSEEVAACLRFFDVSSVRAWREAHEELQQMVAFRTSPSFDSRPGAVHCCVAASRRDRERGAPVRFLGRNAVCEVPPSYSATNPREGSEALHTGVTEALCCRWRRGGGCKSTKRV